MQELGKPLPDSPHAVSVSLPEWRDVVGYEECEPRVVDAMQLGYPRFVYHPLLEDLFAKAAEKFAEDGEFAICFPTKQVANWCADYCQAGRIEKFAEGCFAVLLKDELKDKAKQFWQHAGFGISSRQAEAILEGREVPQNSDVKNKIIQKLAGLSGADAEDIYLFQSGMAAIFMAHKILGGNKTYQLGFPYVDTLKIQERFGAGEFLRHDEPEKIENDADGVFTEFPLNPLLDVVDFDQLKPLKCPLIIDDTLSSWQNFDALIYADIAVTSLTKFFSGVGDVMAGCLILNKKSEHYSKLKTNLDKIYQDLLFAEDAEVLWNNCQNFETRIAAINDNAEDLYLWLKTVPGVKVFYTSDCENYENFKKPGAGHGGIISLEFETQDKAEKFYNALEVSKGPSLGTDYTLVCPYTILAHYKELDWAEVQGVSPHLIRISVGTEKFDQLKNKFEKALKAV